MQQILDEITQGKINSIYLVHGTENYLIDQAKKAFINIVDINNREFNLAIYDLQNSSLDSIIEECESISFFGDKKVVLIENSYIFTSQKVKGNSILEQNIAVLEKYIQNPNPDTVLVFFVPFEELDNRKKIVKQIKQVATLVDVNPLKQQEIILFVQHYLKLSNYQMDRNILEFFLKRVNYKLTACMNELEKLFLAADDTKKITKQLIIDLVAPTLEDNIFNLTEYVLKKDTKKVLEIYHDLVLQKEEPIKLLALLIGQFRLLIQVKILSEEGYSQVDTTNYLKLHPYRVSLALKECQKKSLKELMFYYQKLIEVDFNLKTSSLSSDFQMELLLLNITRGSL